ncbi:MAG: hypothetical protein WBV39_10635 [Rudaea sp.]
MKHLLAVAFAAALCLCACATARAGSLVDISVIDRDNGSILPTHYHHGKLYIAGIPGHRYAVRIANRTGARVLTVLSVDGVNAISGQTADTNQTGYVLDPYQSTEIEGWRKSMAEIAQFNFTALSNSYAARTGRPANVGVIGVAVFREKQRPVWREREEKIAARDAEPAPPAAASMPSPSAEPAGSANRQAKSAMQRSDEAGNFHGLAGARPQPKPEESLGTGHGARESSYASYTAFERASAQPDEVDSIWYDSYRNLVARGVIRVPRPIAIEPHPFPNSFVPDPAG